MTYRIGIDIGGTFTDFVLLNSQTGDTVFHKQLTTPSDPSHAVLEGVTTMLAEQGLEYGDLVEIVHGTTLVTNAIIERRGSRTGMLVTQGMRDVIDIARERRYDLFDLRLTFPAPLVPTQDRREIKERIAYDGAMKIALDPSEVISAVETLIEESSIEALAVCFLNSYANPENEKLAVETIRANFPDLYISGSNDVFPFIREYERWTTTTMNAYVQPVVDSYIGRIEAQLEERGFKGRFYVMTSGGGMVTPETARQYPIRLLESGPAAGALMSGFYGNLINAPNALSFDMGGTTAKGALIRDGKPLKSYEMEVARVHEFKEGSGLPAKAPAIDMIEIGAGGGSIADIDERGVIRVGPRSAGAQPGPACYGQGGEAPTLTDANLMLGYLDPKFFLGGKMSLDEAATERVLNEKLGQLLGISTERAAWGVHDMVNENVAQAFRVHASERGFDYRKSVMVGFGGSGPMHATRVARKLQVPTVVFPMGAGVMSAFGLLISPLSFEIVNTKRVSLASLDGCSFNENFLPLETKVTDLLERSGVPRDDVNLSRKLDMRYEGQGYEIEVSVDADGSNLRESFETAYRQIFSSISTNGAIEVVNWKMEACAPIPLQFERFGYPNPEKGDPIKSHRRAYFLECGGYTDVPIYDRYRLSKYSEFTGPALIEEKESTIVIGVEDRVKVDEHLNIIVTIANVGDKK